ncbi:MAG: histidine kinase [Chryseolinea sp.]
MGDPKHHIYYEKCFLFSRDSHMYQEQANLPWVVIVATGVIVLVSLGLIVLFLVFQNKRQRHISETQELKDKFTRTLLESQLEIREQTLKHLAREIHDNLGQVASLIKINLSTLKFYDDEVATAKVEETKDLVRQLITDLKVLSTNLSSDRATQLGLLNVLENDVEHINRTNRMKAGITHEGEIPAFDDNTTIILYRMAQEILNNSLKHSKASSLRIAIQASEKLFKLVCEDNGVGFDPVEKSKNGGSGLLNLQQRAKVIDARLSIVSSHSGTVVSIELPV